MFNVIEGMDYLMGKTAITATALSGSDTCGKSAVLSGIARRDILDIRRRALLLRAALSLKMFSFMNSVSENCYPNMYVSILLILLI